MSHILGRAFLGQKRQYVGAFAPKHQVDDNLYAKFNISQKVQNKAMTAKERLPSSSQAKQAVLD
jgi:hypothetical protein